MAPAPTAGPDDPADRHLPLTHLAFHVLLALARGPGHGYAIIRDIEQRTDGSLSLRSGTLYTALHRLAAQGLLRQAEQGETVTSSRRRHRYDLTPLGREVAALEAERLRSMLVTAGDRRLIDLPDSVA